MGSWKPPRGHGEFPKRWFARAPDDPLSYRTTALLGWRTNLERAILREDEERVNQIVSERRPNDIREYVECRILLTKCAKRGLLKACRMLIEKCHASVEGIQAPDTDRLWHDISESSGNEDDLTPLHQACRNGQAEAVTLLLDKGAAVNRIDNSRAGGTALHHAVCGGQTGCARIVCERGAAISYVNPIGHEALDISMMLAEGDIYRKRVQTRMQQILREYDSRCSTCRAPNASRRCPCHKERYCDTSCQKRRWKHHKAYHNEVLEEGED